MICRCQTGPGPSDYFRFIMMYVGRGLSPRGKYFGFRDETCAGRTKTQRHIYNLTLSSGFSWGQGHAKPRFSRTWPPFPQLFLWNENLLMLRTRVRVSRQSIWRAHCEAKRLSRADRPHVSYRPQQVNSQRGRKVCSARVAEAETAAGALVHLVEGASSAATRARIQKLR